MTTRHVQGLKFPENSIAHTCLLNTHPDARASVRITSRDPFAHPCVDSNILGHHSDVQRLAQCITKEREVAKVLSDDLGYKLSEFSLVGRNTDADLLTQVCSCLCTSRAILGRRSVDVLSCMNMHMRALLSSDDSPFPGLHRGSTYPSMHAHACRLASRGCRPPCMIWGKQLQCRSMHMYGVLELACRCQ